MLGWNKLEHTTYFPIMYWADWDFNTIATLWQTAAFKPPLSLRFKHFLFKTFTLQHSRVMTSTAMQCKCVYIMFWLLTQLNHSLLLHNWFDSVLTACPSPPLSYLWKSSLSIIASPTDSLLACRNLSMQSFRRGSEGWRPVFLRALKTVGGNKISWMDGSMDGWMDGYLLW